jgi:hypothetical protein
MEKVLNFINSFHFEPKSKHMVLGPNFDRIPRFKECLIKYSKAKAEA